MNLCPSFDFQQTNQQLITKSPVDDSYLLSITNNFTSLAIKYPQVKLSCPGQSASTLLSIAVVDESSYLLDQTPYIFTFSSVPGSNANYLHIPGSRLLNMSSSDYNLTVFMYYQRSGQNSGVSLYSKQIMIRRQVVDNVLIAAFSQDFFSVSAGSSDTVILDASASRDYQNLANRNFSYRWNCSSLVPIVLCPKSPTASSLTITAAQRNQY